MTYIYTYREQDNCKVEGCKNEYSSKGYCRKHYLRWHRHGDPLYKGRNPKGFWKGVICKVDGCETSVRSNGLCLKHKSRAYREKNNKLIADYIKRVTEGVYEDDHQ